MPVQWIALTRKQPHIDPVTNEMILTHSSFIKPFTRYSVVSAKGHASTPKEDILGVAVPGVTAPKLMHDFGVSREYTVVIDMPLVLDPRRLLRGKSVLSFDHGDQTRFAIFPRHQPNHIKWFTTEACCIFHTVNTWDRLSNRDKTHLTVNMLVCRMTSPTIIYASGNLPLPANENGAAQECRLYYYQFDINKQEIVQQWALCAIPFEFPHVPKQLAMSATRFVYGCSVSRGEHAEQFQQDMRVGSLVKIDVQALIAKGLANTPCQMTGCVDERSMEDILATNDVSDAIRVFPFPGRFSGQECTFVPRTNGESEDDGWLLTFVFDEDQLDGEGSAPEDAFSELWVIDARTMNKVVARIRIPERVPHGLHGNWFTRQEIAEQRSVTEFRSQRR